MRYIYLALLIIFCNIGGIVYAEDTLNSSDSWDKFVDSYTQNQIQRPVTPQAYNNALQTLDNFGKIKKRNINNSDDSDAEDNSENDNTTNQKSHRSLFSGHSNSKNNAKKSNSSGSNHKNESSVIMTDPLLRLPIDIYYNKQTVKNGFYSVNCSVEDNKYYLLLTQGSNIAVQVEASLIRILPSSSITSIQSKQSNEKSSVLQNFGNSMGAVRGKRGRGGKGKKGATRDIQILENGTVNFEVIDSDNAILIYQGRGLVLQSNFSLRKPIVIKKENLVR